MAPQTTPTFSWLHLTDLHCGMKNQDWLWPHVRDMVFTDLERLYDNCGSWDLVVFTGDLTQKGHKKEFDNVTRVLNELWELFEKTLNFSPRFLAVPGNHDLKRPTARECERAAVKMLLEWEKHPDIHEKIWNYSRSEYRTIITRAFKNFTAWWDNCPHKVHDTHSGIIPGDFSATLEKDGAKIGILGLNTSFLQLARGNYEGRLGLHTKQFDNACPYPDGETTQYDGPRWVQQHHACLLLTHHPPAWLNRKFRDDHLHANITAHGRFVVHLCGHQHDTVYRSWQVGGVEARRIWQGHSLFSSEPYGENHDLRRSHGYAIGRIQFSGGDQGRLLFWPRIDGNPGGQRELVAESYTIRLTDHQHTEPEAFKLIQSYTKPAETPKEIAHLPSIDNHTSDTSEGQSMLSFPLRRKIIQFLTSLSNVHDNYSQRAFIESAGLDNELVGQIKFGDPANQFFELLVPILSQYGELQDGRTALIAMLEAAKEYVGPQKKADCGVLIEEVQKVWEVPPLSNSESESVIPIIKAFQEEDKPVFVVYGDISCSYIKGIASTFQKHFRQFQNDSYILLDMKDIKQENLAKTCFVIAEKIEEQLLTTCSDSPKKPLLDRSLSLLHLMINDQTSPDEQLMKFTQFADIVFYQDMADICKDGQSIIIVFEHFEEVKDWGTYIYNLIMNRLLESGTNIKVLIFNKGIDRPRLFLGSGEEYMKTVAFYNATGRIMAKN